MDADFFHLISVVDILCCDTAQRCPRVKLRLGGGKFCRLPTKLPARFPKAVGAGTPNGGMNPPSPPAVKHYSHFIKDAPPQQAALYAARLPSITATTHKT